MNRDEIIKNSAENGGMLDVLLALQKIEGYLTKDAIEAVASYYGVFPNQVFETASFYGMLYTKPKTADISIEICNGAPCHVKGADKIISAIEKELGITIGGTTADGRYSFAFTECQGHCGEAPTVVINGKIYTDVTVEKIHQLLTGGTIE